MKNPLSKVITKLIFAFLLLILLFGKISAQKEVDFWYFGKQNGLDFSGGGGAPTVLTNGAINSFEGSASMADYATGQILFYTNGITVWNKNHVKMPNGNGLMGGIGSAGNKPTSTTQAAIIIPQPGNCMKYYVFTNDCIENNGAAGFRYSIVDMSLDGGLGDVTTKNVALFGPSTEKVTGVHHANKKDIWVITHGKFNKFYYAYLLTSAGVSAPVVTIVGSTNISESGYLKISPNGKKLVNTEFSNSNQSSGGFVEMLDFNNATGVISNPVKLVQNSGYYGVSFSPNSSLLYLGGGNASRFDQFDLSSGVTATIIASKTNLYVADNLGTFWGLQMGPDKQIYCTMGYQSLHVIHNPNVYGTGCNTQKRAINLTEECYIGVPNFVESFFDTSMYLPRGGEGLETSILGNDTVLCYGDEMIVSVDQSNVSFLWSNGSTSSSIGVTSPGQYKIKVTASCASVSDSVNIDFTYCDPSLYVPTAFSPDGNDLNDRFMAKAENIEHYDMKVFNRWGQLLFESYDLDTGWDGTYSGTACPIDVYVWKIEYDASTPSSAQITAGEKEHRKAIGRVALLH